MDIECRTCGGERNSGPHSCDRAICPYAGEHHEFQPIVRIGSMRLTASQLHWAAVAIDNEDLFGELADGHTSLSIELTKLANRMEVR